MKRKLFAALTGFLVLFALAGCGKRQDTSAIGSIYKAQTYTTNGKTHKTTKAVEMTLYLTNDNKSGVLSTATLAQAPYYRRYETITRKTSGNKTKLTTTGEMLAETFADASDAEAGINTTKYSYNKTGDSHSSGSYTQAGKTLDLKLGNTTWHFKRTEKKTRFLLPYGLADQAKQAKLDQKN